MYYNLQFTAPKIHNEQFFFSGANDNLKLINFQNTIVLRYKLCRIVHDVLKYIIWY